MQNQQFKTSLTRTAWICGAVILLIVCMGGSAHSETTSIFQIILFIVGLAMSLALSIGVMTGIFFGAVAMTDPQIAAQLWADLKTKWSR